MTSWVFFRKIWPHRIAAVALRVPYACRSPLHSNVRDDANGKPWYFWGPIKREENQILAWRPDVAKFKALGKNCKLPSRVDDNDIFLDYLTPEQLKVITSQSEGVLYEWNDPLVFIRIVK